jgi:hypothetical protein
MRSLASTLLLRLTWALTIAALLALSASAGLFDLARPAQAATAALSSPAGQRLATNFIADQLQTAVPGLGAAKAQALAAKVAADPDTLVALKHADLKSASAPQDRAALLQVVASQLKQSNPKVAAATQTYAGRVQAAATGQGAAAATGLPQPPSPVGGLLQRLQQFTGGASNLSAVMSDLKAKLAHIARVLAALAVLTAALALACAPARARVVRSLGWMLISISLIPAAIGRLLPDLVLARMSSDWAQALAVGLRVAGSRLIGLFVGLLFAGVVLLVLGFFGARLGSMFTAGPTPGERRPGPGGAVPAPGGPRQEARSPRPAAYVPAELAITRPIETVHDTGGYAPPPAGYPYPQSPPPAFPGGPYPDYGPYGEPPPDRRGPS